MHRNGNSMIDTELIKKTTELYSKKISLYTNFYDELFIIANDHFNLKMKKILNTDPTIDPTTNIYQIYVERQLLRDAEDFYSQEQTTLILKSDSIAAYLPAVRFNL